MSKADTYQSLLKAMQCASGNPQPFVTREDLAAFGAALLSVLEPRTTMVDSEYCTLAYLCRRFQCSREFMATRLAHSSIRKVQLPGGKRVKYHIQDALDYLKSSSSLTTVYNS